MQFHSCHNVIMLNIPSTIFTAYFVLYDISIICYLYYATSLYKCGHPCIVASQCEVNDSYKSVPKFRVCRNREMLRLLGNTSPQMKLISLDVSATSSCLHQ